jgi:hypothetical protein
MPAAHVIEQLEQLEHLAAERAHDADARERLTDTPVNDLRVLADRAVDRPRPLREQEAEQHDARHYSDSR